MEENPFFTEFADMAAGLVQQQGLSLRQIAKGSGISLSSVHRAVHRQGRMPSWTNFERLQSFWKKRGSPVFISPW